jgi:hypothetical protein
MRIALSLIVVAAIASAALLCTSADARYRFAERCYEKGHFETASFLCKMALKRTPRHAPSRALYTEIEFILGRGKATPPSCDYSRFMQIPSRATNP